ncbi:MAG TPA: nucleotidyltransferase family protein [Opitutaceae bacterium]|nr:nucleotidyltransferase family protein [Opitutaceae bacterium]
MTASRAVLRAAESRPFAAPPPSVLKPKIRCSPELTLLLALLRAAIRRGAPSPPAEPVDGEEFWRLAQRHRVAAYLYQRLPGIIEERCDSAVAGRFRNAAQLTVQRALLQGGIQLKLVRMFEGEGIGVIPVKGLVLSRQLYGAIGMRHVGDIDLLVRKSDVAKADALLRRTHLRRTRPDFDLTPRQLREFIRIKPEFEYHDASAGVRVELLWRLDGIPDDEVSLWTHAGRCRIGGHDFRAMPPQIEALYLLQHGARHGWFRLFWLVDAALVLGRSNEDWSALISGARGRGIERPVLQAAQLARDLLAIPVPPPLEPLPHERRVVSALKREAVRQISRAIAPTEPLGEWSRQLGYRLKLQRSVRQKFATISPHVFTPETWRVCRLPDRWFFLYHLLAPFAWLRRRAKRSV